MIKFFRNIRKKLIEQSKVRNYFFYAIGEIILVVIGILIALQINNWNEGRKDLQLRNKYSKALINDLKADTLSFQRSLDTVLTDSSRIAGYENRLQSDEATYDTIAQIFRQEFNPFVYSEISLNNATLNSLISTGDIGIFPDSVRKQLTELDQRQNEAINIIFLTAEKYLTILNQTTQDFPLENYLFDMHPKFREDIWNEADKFKMAGSFDQVLDWKRAYNLNRAHITRNLKRLSIQLIETLNQLEDIE